MNTTDWQHYYVTDQSNKRWKTGALYEPLVSLDQKILCMRFDPDSKFRNKPVSNELINDCFTREIKYLKKFNKYPWCANLIDVDTSKREIYIEWNIECCEQTIVNGADLSNILPDWKEQLQQIVLDIKINEVYKITMYPCYHFIKEDKLKAFAFYTTCDYEEQPIDINLYRPILNEERSKFINSVWPDGKVDFSILNKHSLTEYVKWPEDPLPDIYRKIYLDNH